MGYVLAVTRSKVNDWIARQLRERSLQGELAAAPEPSCAARHADLLVDLGRALERLPLPQRRALEQIYLRGLTYAEAAQVLGLSLRQVKRLQLRGLAALRRALDVDV